MARKARVFRLWSCKRSQSGDVLSRSFPALITQNKIAAVDISSPHGVLATTDAIMRLNHLISSSWSECPSCRNGQPGCDFGQ